jgi:PPK2 family polyphosphate:nucleotide phosphotransferase
VNRVSSAPTSSVLRVAPGEKISLKKIDPADTGGLSRHEAEKELGRLNERLNDLQALVNAAGVNAVLIVLQGLDASGKDGTIRQVLQQVSPQGCRVVSFKEPTPLEQSHDFLWRVHRETPEKGMIAIFNRSHYEDVLVPRVHETVPRAVWTKRYQQIREFEALLVAEGTLVVKFFLHLSKKEQKKRLEQREHDPNKAYKVAPSDWAERRHWSDYRRAYEDVMAETSTEDAPWIVVPSDAKWYRNLAVASTLVARLEMEEKRWQKAVVARGKEALARVGRD